MLDGERWTMKADLPGYQESGVGRLPECANTSSQTFHVGFRLALYFSSSERGRRSSTGGMENSLCGSVWYQ
jgi:hypothetical protein